MEGTKDNKGQ